ncbi:MAG: hypothetical protein ACYDH9_05070 [Limisphaerales bacterium]
MNSRTAALLALCLAGVSQAQTNVSGAATPSGPVWGYQLIEGSLLVDDCYCGRATITYPLRGAFELVQTNQNPLYTYYTLQNIAWSAGSATTAYRLAGQGVFQIGGEVAVVQTMTLQVQLDNGFTNRTLVFTNDVSSVTRAWPNLDISLVQSNAGPVIQFYRLHLTAAPFREIWFSTAGGMTSGNRSSPTNSISSGDLLSFSGRVVKPNFQLLGQLGLMPGFGDYGIDAVDVTPGGEILFSLNQDVFSETIGPLHHGDLLSNRGRIVQTNAQLLAAFQPPAGTPDAGLDAVHVMDDGEILFSIATNVSSQSLNTMLGRGDILSNKGRVFKTNQQLLAAFHPAVTDYDYGLDALYVWPGGEVWFSTEEGFPDAQLGPVSSGDLLSDQGFIVYRNLELVSAFAPLEDVSNFGLDALFIVTDTTAPALPPRLPGFAFSASTGNASLNWTAKGRVFQVEKAGDVSGVFAPVSPVIPDSIWIDAGNSAANAKAFYRLRQW